ncbi:MAG: hypothetical protein PQ968_06880, partial [Methanobacterium sp.]
KKLFEILDEVGSLEDIMTRYIEKGEIDNELVANWTFDTLKLVEGLGKIVEQIEDRLDLLEEETEQKEF